MTDPKQKEIDLARKLALGDMTAFEPFMELVRNKVFQYSLMMCGQRDDAEEVAQDTLLKVFENFDQLREPEKVRPWVFRIARNACYMKRRKSVFAPPEELSLDDLKPVGSDGAVPLQVADWSQLPDDEMLRGQVKERLEQAIKALPEGYRAVVLLRDVEELSTAEAADILGVSTDVIKTRLHRARLAIRDRLTKFFADGRYLRHVDPSGQIRGGESRSE